VMRTGRSIARAATHTFVWVDRNGVESPVDPSWSFQLTTAGGNVGWSISPDGQRLAIGLNTTSGDDIWIKQLPTGSLSRLSFTSTADVRPRWSRDGRYVSYTSWNAGDGPIGGSSDWQALVRRAADGTGGDSVLVPRRTYGVFEHAFSPDGEYLVVRMGGLVNVVGGRDISIIRPWGDTTPVRSLPARRSPFLPTASGSPSSPTRPAASRCTSARSRRWTVVSGRSRTAVVARHSGIEMAGSSST